LSSRTSRSIASDPAPTAGATRSAVARIVATAYAYATMSATSNNAAAASTRLATTTVVGTVRTGSTNGSVMAGRGSVTSGTLWSGAPSGQTIRLTREAAVVRRYSCGVADMTVSASFAGATSTTT